MGDQPNPYITASEYLVIERDDSQHKHEYLCGEMYLMSGASREHNLICVNFGRLVGNGIAGSDCEYYMNDMRVKVSPTGLYTYPDVVVTCEEPEFEDEQVDTLLNPQVIVEVLSESTEGYDRGKKFEHYRRLGSVREYLLVSQDRPHVDCFTLSDQGVWELSEADGLEAAISIGTLGLSLPLAEVYAKVAFEPESSPTDEGDKSKGGQRSFPATLRAATPAEASCRRRGVVGGLPPAGETGSGRGIGANRCGKLFRMPRRRQARRSHRARRSRELLSARGRHHAGCR